MKSTGIIAALLWGMVALGCQSSAGDTDSETQTTGTTTAGPETTDSSTGGDFPGCSDGGICLSTQRDVDILFVLDNSSSMAQEQALLSANIAALIDVLEDPKVRADYRIGIVTTDLGNPRCPPGSDNGRLIRTSCIDRIQDFNLDDPPTDATLTCTSYCEFSDTELPIDPTPITQDASQEPRAWLERIGLTSNLPQNVSTTQAMQCFGPQGIAGCGFESPLESMYRALNASEDPQSPNFGFLRETALLQVVILTDELDCSYNPDHGDIFVSNNVFWNPGDMFSTSTTCWRAGVACESPGPDHGECWTQDHDDQGNPTDDPDAAVLYPLARYVDFLQTLENDRKALDANAEVYVSVITGVPQGYPASPIEYTQDGATQEFLDLYGVAPGCLSTGGGEGLPPVRLREFAESFAVDDQTNLFSICDDDYTPALETIADNLRGALNPACVPECVADSDPNTEVLDPVCTFYNTDPITKNVTEVKKCVQEDSNWAPQEGESLCYIELKDASNATPTKDDDLSAKCINNGWNLEIVTVKVNPLLKIQLTYDCEISQDPAADCPLL